MSIVLCLIACLQEPAVQEPGLPTVENLRYAGERYFGAIRRLTTEGENAEGYFSSDGTHITYQSRVGAMECDQIFDLDLLTGARRLVSTGKGRTTCSYFMPGNESILFASTHGAADGCLQPADFSQGYVWKVYSEFDLWVRDLQTWELKPLAPSPGYDAEAVVSPDGKKIAFTSMRGGDLDVWIMNVDGSNLRQLTSEVGYDGGAFFSPDSKRLVFRNYHPNTAETIADYKTLLAQDLIRPTTLDIWVMDIDGSNKQQVTDNGAANFAPFFHPDGQRILYSSNQDGGGRNFDLWITRDNGTGNERVTQCPLFDGFPMFSPDGKRLIFASNRASKDPHSTNLFMAEWIEPNRAE